MYLLTGTVIILNSEFWILNYTYFSFPIEHFCSLVLHYCFNLSKITVILRFVFRQARNRLQRYCFFWDWPNFSATFFNIFCTFFVSGWFSALRFSVWFLLFLRFTNLRRKSGAKVLLFFGLTKYFGKKSVIKHHFLCKWLIINNGKKKGCTAIF